MPASQASRADAESPASPSCLSNLLILCAGVRANSSQSSCLNPVKCHPQCDK